MHSAYWHMKTPQSNEFIWWGILFAALHSIDNGFFIIWRCKFWMKCLKLENFGKVFTFYFMLWFVVVFNFFEKKMHLLYFVHIWFCILWLAIVEC